MNDPIEEWLKEVENAPLWEDTEAWPERVRKLLALVREYREANQFYSRSMIQDGELEGNVQWIYDRELSGCLDDPIGGTAIKAEQKALEIIK